MKVLLSSIGLILFYLTAFGCGLWTIVEFILYLVKDTEFNWWSLWITIISALSSFILMFMTAILQVREKDKIIDRTKSTFQDRLKELAKEKGYK